MSKATLLIIDDDLLVRETIVGYLEDSHYSVLEASNGEEGLQVFKEKNPDLVLCDLRMPRIDGLDLLKMVLSERPGTPFIVVSGAGVMSDVVDALRLGASDYLVKPLSDLAVLEHSIERNLESSRLQKQNEMYRKQLETTNQQLEAELNAGRKVQQKMLPPDRQEINGVLLAHHVDPCHFLSGDFVDYFALNSHQTLFFIVDVSGHGVSSAIITVLIKNYVYSMRDRWEAGQQCRLDDPSFVFAGLNQHLIDLDLERHATMFIGIVDSQASKLIYSCAAHFPTPVLVKKDGAVSLPTDGLPVGLMSDALYRNHEIALADINGIFLCSDGLLEIMQEASLVDKEARLLDLVQQADNDLDKICAAIGMSDIEDIPDDITLLTVNGIGQH